jgi:hypothetical protein
MSSKTLLVPQALVLSLVVGCGVVIGNGEQATEARTVSEFSSVVADNGLLVAISIDPMASGDVELDVAAESNLIDFITTTVEDDTLTATVTESVDSTLQMRVVGVASGLAEATANNGATLDIDGVDQAAITLESDNGASLRAIGTVDELSLISNNGGSATLTDLEASSAIVEVDNGASATICVTGSITGSVENGADLTVQCGGDTSGLTVRSGGALH